MRNGAFPPIDYASHPITPIDMNYSQSMLPSNLLINSPYFPQMNQRQMGPLRGQMSNSSQGSPYLTKIKSGSNLDQLNLSRTLTLKNLNDKLTLKDVLDEIDHGPIEYCKMFSSPAPAYVEDAKVVKTCCISFLNSNTAVSFQMKYQKNSSNFKGLKSRLLNSTHLRIVLNDSVSLANGSNNSKQDFLKMKTLNHIMEHNASRSLQIKVILINTKNTDIIEKDVKSQIMKFGDIDVIDVSYNDSKSRATVTVHYTSIDSAIKCQEYYMKAVRSDREFSVCFEEEETNFSYLITNVSFQKDRCDRSMIGKVSSSPSLNSRIASVVKSSSEDGEDISIDESQMSEDIIFPNETAEHSANYESLENVSSLSSSPITDSGSSTFLPINNNVNNSFYLSQMRVNHQHHQPSHPPPESIYKINPDPFNVGNRTIYLGNLHPQTTVEEIANNVRAGGLVESIKHHADKKVCFITFVDPNVALKFYLNHQVLHRLIIHGYDITVGWAKNHSGPLNRQIALAVTAGASRNVYIGIKLVKGATPESKPKLPNETVLRKDFSKFGELEQINFYHNKDCGFLNFINIIDAIKLVQLFETKNEERINYTVKDGGEIYKKYEIFKISFAKDRCGNSPKFSYKKKPSLSRRSTSNQNLHEPTIADVDKLTPEESPINEEAAMVFGIIEPEKVSSDIDTTPLDEDTPSPEVDSVKNEESSEETCINDKPIQNAEIFDNEEIADEHEVSKEVKSGDHDDDNKDDDDDDNDDDDDDDFSIIIDANDTFESKKEDPKKSTRRRSSDSFRPHVGSTNEQWYNSKGNSISPRSRSAKLSNNKYGSRNHQPPRSYSNYSLNYNNYHGYSNNYPNGYYPVYLPQLQPQYFYPPTPRGSYSSSGSQVMAQYLAKSHHDNLLYAASILSNDVEYEQ